ncbi:hypothetical protein EOS_41080 [Caballeronia mineralivorans PML1(12)]|uniref:DUF4148 domain-containing protein n=1 Tax=Caballeronia mineralivorans PML1(12) TaxID=908627 RepID=A0A0J1CIN3_9BURK|nr:hypothetical protein EOS_41080 [Caballeronia mineralivorans PML1(12)]
MQNAYSIAAQHSAATTSVAPDLPKSVTGSTAAQETPAAGLSTFSGKTRAQVREELVEAQRMGLVPSSKTDYPPSAATIARNQARFQQVEPFWRAHGDIPMSVQ